MAETRLWPTIDNTASSIPFSGLTNKLLHTGKPTLQASRPGLVKSAGNTSPLRYPSLLGMWESSIDHPSQTSQHGRWSPLSIEVRCLRTEDSPRMSLTSPSEASDRHEILRYRPLRSSLLCGSQNIYQESIQTLSYPLFCCHCSKYNY
jgi:hypothetical protein